MRELYTFDDVLIQPAYSDIYSRSEIDLTSQFLGVNMGIPVVSANMDYITGPEMAKAMRFNGGLGILHRFASRKERVAHALSQIRQNVVALSVGVKEIDLELSLLISIDIDYRDFPAAKIVCIDVAHGYHLRVKAAIDRIKRELPNWKIIAGNVATVDGALFLQDAGADAIKIGIGPGSVCTTRIVTGVGVPQLSAISEIANQVNIPIIADGGIRNSGDIAKALAAGADLVMLGYLLAGASETPGEAIETGDGRRLRPYRGQSIFGTNDKIYTREGISGWVDEKGSVSGILKQLMGGLRSSMSYVGARNLSEFRQKAEFVRVSPSTLSENNTRVRETI